MTNPVAGNISRNKGNPETNAHNQENKFESKNTLLQQGAHIFSIATLQAKIRKRNQKRDVRTIHSSAQKRGHSADVNKGLLQT